jgi:hypothetical protein
MTGWSLTVTRCLRDSQRKPGVADLADDDAASRKHVVDTYVTETEPGTAYDTLW